MREPINLFLKFPSRGGDLTLYSCNQNSLRVLVVVDLKTTNHENHTNWEK